MSNNSEQPKSEGFLYNVLSGLVVLGSLVAGALAYPNLPARVPMHWNLAGQVDRYSSAFAGAFMMPLMLAGIFLLMVVIPKLDPRAGNYLKMGRVYAIIRFCILLVLATLHLGLLGAALGYGDIVPHLASGGVGLLIFIMGNYFGKVKYNYTFGLRTPWTLASEQVWYRTHRAMGPLWMLGGFLLAAASFVPVSFRIPLFGISLSILIIAPMAYSYVIFRRLER
ncbi:MAG TPA: SdpI family protein [Bacillota bacterium]|nr:SdpI family protein [Bacillota bacterium]